jgi:hypothetical protein
MFQGLRALVARLGSDEKLAREDQDGQRQAKRVDFSSEKRDGARYALGRHRHGIRS